MHAVFLRDFPRQRIPLRVRTMTSRDASGERIMSQYINVLTYYRRQMKHEQLQTPEMA